MSDSLSVNRSPEEMFTAPLLPQGPSRRDTMPTLGTESREGETDKRKGRLSLPSTSGQANGSRERRYSAIGARSSVEEEEEEDEEAEGEMEGEGEGEGEGETAKNKRKRGMGGGLTSCIACRRGKRRCEPSPLVDPSHPDAAKLPCARCRRFAHECVRMVMKKRKGPAPTDLSAISDAVFGFQSSSGGTGSGEGLMELPPTPSMSGGFGRPDNGPRTLSASGSGSGYSGVPPPLLSSSGRSASHGQMGAMRPREDDMRRGSVMSTMSQDYGHSGGSFVRGDSQYSNDTMPAFPGLNRTYSSNLPLPDNLDQVVSPEVVNTIIGLFFDYVYPLTPCLHRPTFLASLSARQDKSDPIFFALTLAVLASTLVQVPRSLVNLDKDEVEDLARVCVKVARAKLGLVFENSIPVNISFVIISYLEGIVHLFLGNNTAHIMCNGMATQLALAMRLNEEASYEFLDPIESEIRRRTFWLLFQADKSAACTRARTINLRLEDAASLRLPAEVDDEQITQSGITMHPGGSTPIIAGFNIVTNLFRIMNDALLLQRRKAPPTVDSILADLQNVNNLREKVVQTTAEVSSQLKLKTSMDSRVSSPAHDWEAKLEARFLDFFHSAGDETHALNSYLVLQGNILVTQSVVRLVLLHTKEALLRQLAMITQMPMQGVGSLAGMQAGEPAEDIACELLDGLNSLPVECVATNGPSLVQKVRFVAIQLMECSVSPSPTTARSQRLLVQFLSVLSVIEGMYTFGKEISAE